jgi:putative ABC transport system permease protein
MTPGYRHRPGRTAAAAAHAYAGPLLITALITLVVCAGLVGGQRELSIRTTGAFQTYVQQHASSADLTATSSMTAGTSADVTQATGEMAAKLPAPSGAFALSGWSFTAPQATGDLPQWLPHETPETSTTTHQAPSELTLVTAANIDREVRYASGGAPACRSTCTGADTVHPVPIAVSRATAQSLRLVVGQVYSLSSKAGTPLYISISGLYDASGTTVPGPAADLLSGLLQPFEQRSVNVYAAVGPVPYIQWVAQALVAPDALGPLTAWQQASVTWNYHLVPADLTADRAVPFATRIRALIASSIPIAVAGDDAAGRTAQGPVFAPAAIVSGVPDTVSGFEADAGAAHALGLFVLVAAGAVGIATILLALRVLFARQERDLSLRRARGLAPIAAARRAALQAVGCTLPAAAIGIAASLWAVRGVDDGFVFEVAGAVVIGIPLAAAVTALRSSTTSPGMSPDAAAAARAPSARRSVLLRRKALRRTGVILLLLLLVGAATVVRTQLATSTSPDLLSASLPTLAAAVGALAVTSLVAVLVRPAVRLASRRTRSAAPFLAAAHAARRPTLPTAASVALLVATSSAVFASCFTASLDSARQLDALRRTGADLHVQTDADIGTSLDPAALARVSAAPGVRAAATGTVFTNQQLVTPQGQVTATVIVVDPAEYDRLLSLASLDSPGLSSALHTLATTTETAASGTVPALISPNLAGYFGPGGDQLGLPNSETVPIAPVAQTSSIPAAGGVGVFVVLSRAALEKQSNGVAPPVTSAWYDLTPGAGSAEAISRAETIPLTTVAVREQLAAGLDAGPVGAVARWTSGAAVAFDLVLAAVCLLLAGALTAPTRAAGKAFLATLGARRATGVLASVLETLPAFVMIALVAAVAALGALGVLAPLVGQLAVGSPNGLPLSALATPPAAVWAVVAVPAAGLLLAAARAVAEHRTRLSFLRDERAA